jgi:hypothetical protein
MSAPASTDGENTKVHPTFFFKDTSKRDLVTRAGRLCGSRYNRYSLQVEGVYYSNYIRVAILGIAPERYTLELRSNT